MIYVYLLLLLPLIVQLLADFVFGLLFQNYPAFGRWAFTRRPDGGFSTPQVIGQACLIGPAAIACLAALGYALADFFHRLIRS